VKRALVWVACLAIAGGCATGPSASCLLTAKPSIRKQSIAWHLVDVTVLSQVEQVFHPSRPADNFLHGAVSDSSFFTNRDIARMTADDVRAGPTQRAQGPFVITRLKGEGKTRGFFVTDAKGDRFLFKLDVVGYPQLVTGAEVVTSKLLHALGYHVPSYEIVDVAVDDLSASQTLGYDQQQVRQLVREHLQQGRLRVSASRLVDGEILGPFRFKHHRDCAECRALNVAAAWVNHTDTKDHNTLMVWTGQRAVGYLIDFGSSLGADASRGPKRPCQGWYHDVDLRHWTAELLTFGLHGDGCDPREPIISPAVGRFSARFDPRQWKPYAPNLAFEELTKREARWMAGRIAQVSRAQVEAAVAAGAYDDPQDAAYLVETLLARQQAIVRAYLPETLP